MVQSKLGNYKESLEYYDKSLKIYLKIFGEKHNIIAEIYKKIGITLKRNI